jgi:HPt (histidine-containing phosphotransfer) domain-containing protein
MDAPDLSPLDSPPGGVLRSAYAADPDMQDLIRTFVSRLPRRAEQMMQLLGEQDLSQLRQVVHQLKGAGGGFGFDEITHRAAQVEKTIQAQATLEIIVQQVTSLVRLLERVDGYSESPPNSH